MAPFNRVHESSYQSSIVTMSLSCTGSEIQHHIGQKSPILTYPSVFITPVGGDP